MPGGFRRGFWGYGWNWPTWGWGGNPYPFCRRFPWLPRWWWATPYASQFTSTIPYYLGYGLPFWGAYGTPFGRTGYPVIK